MRPDLERSELQTEFDSLSAEIEATKRDLGREVNDENRLVLQTKHDDLYDRRRRVVDRILVLPRSQNNKGGRTVEYDEITKMLYEIRADVAILKSQLSDHVARCNESAGLPPQMLTFLAIGGIVMLLLLAFVVIRIGIPA